MNSIILMGIKHCGKTTQAKLISKYLNIPFFDTDDEIFKQTKKTARQIYNQEGEEFFKIAEENACKVIANKISKQKKAIIATGGGICNNKNALEVLRPLGTFVFLQTEESIATNRIIEEVSFTQDGKICNVPSYIAKKNPHTKDDVRTIFHDFYVKRNAKYLSLCDVSVKQNSMPEQENMLYILNALGISKNKV